MKQYYMYILRCANNSYYVGSTNDINARIKTHNAGEGASYTRKHRPVNLAYFEEYNSRSDAEKREKQIKGWNRLKKENLIKGIWQKNEM